MGLHETYVGAMRGVYARCHLPSAVTLRYARLFSEFGPHQLGVRVIDAPPAVDGGKQYLVVPDGSQLYAEAMGTDR